MLLVGSLQALDARHSESDIVLVAHGDTLSCLCAIMAPETSADVLKQHRQFGMATAEVRALRVPPAAANRAADWAEHAQKVLAAVASGGRAAKAP